MGKADPVTIRYQLATSRLIPSDIDHWQASGVTKDFWLKLPQRSGEVSVMTTGHQTTASATPALEVPISVIGLSLSAFFAISFLGCVLLGLVVPDAGMHKPWLQFFPGFEWWTVQGIVIGLIWTQVYGWWIALVFGSLFNFFASRRR